MIVNPFTNLSTACWDFWGLSLFVAPYLSSKTVISEIKQLSRPFSLMVTSRLSLPLRKNMHVLVSSNYCIDQMVRSFVRNFLLSFISLIISSGEEADSNPPNELKKSFSFGFLSFRIDFASLSRSSSLLTALSPSKSSE